MKDATWKSSVAPIVETTLVASISSTNWLVSAGIDGLERLEQHDVAEDLQGAEPERQPGLDLARDARIRCPARTISAL